MADTLFVLNVCVRSSALPCSPNDRRRRDITSCFSVRATVERKLWCYFYLPLRVYVCVLYMSCHSCVEYVIGYTVYRRSRCPRCRALPAIWPQLN